MNFAAESHVDRSIECPDIFLQTNVLGTGILMDVSKICDELGWAPKVHFEDGIKKTIQWYLER